jgi:Calx-beta domain
MEKQNPRPGDARRAASRAGTDHVLIDPNDVRRHARLLAERRRAGPLGRIARYAVVVLVLAGAFVAYRNFDTLRNASLDFSALTNLFAGGGPSATQSEGNAAGSEVVEGAGVVGEAAPTSLAGETSPARASSTAETPTGAAAPASGSDTPPLAVAATAPPASAAVASAPAAAQPAPQPEPERPVEPETFGFGLESVHVSEADASAAILVLRNGGRRGVSSVAWWTSDGTATSGSDYASLGVVVERFAAGEQNRTIHVPIVGDRVAEGPETFYVNLGAGPDAGPGSKPVERLEVVIDDDD